MVGRSQELTDAIVETSNQLAETIATRADEVNSTLKKSGESLFLGLDLRGGEVAARLEQAGDSVTEAMIARSAALTDALRESAEHVAGVVATRERCGQRDAGRRVFPPSRKCSAIPAPSSAKRFRAIHRRSAISSPDISPSSIAP